MLYNIGTTHDKRGEFLLAFQVYLEALDMNASDKRNKDLYGNIVNTVGQLYISNYKAQSNKEKACETQEGVVITKDTCPAFVESLYQQSFMHRGLVKDDKGRDGMLACLDVAREIAERFNYKCGRVVLVLLLFSMNHGEKERFQKSRLYYEEAREMAKSLPPGEDDSVLPGELGMIEVLKK